jgi:putative membrane protein insertion efficiency factor
MSDPLELDGEEAPQRAACEERAAGRLDLIGRDPGVAVWRRIATVPLRIYKRLISPFMPPACRFYPTCSMYAIEAIEVHGLYGLWLAAYRLLRCNPLCKGGFDPVPPRRGRPSQRSHPPGPASAG